MERLEKVYWENETTYKLYKKGGQHLVYDYVNQGLLKHDKWGYCEPCEIDSPIYDDSCLACGSMYKESEVG